MSAGPLGIRPQLIFGSIAATGAGLHVAATYIAHEARIGSTAAVLAVAVPVAVFVLADTALYTLLLGVGDPFHLGLLVATAAVLVLSVVLAANGVSMAVCLVVITAAPLVIVVGYETIGHRHQAAALEALLSAE